MKKILIVIFLSLASTSFAENNNKYLKSNSGYKFDYESGNSFYWNTNQNKETHVLGNNLNTGSTWNTTINPNGDMNGMDSNGNMWNYSKDAGRYINYGTGQIKFDWEK